MLSFYKPEEDIEKTIYKEDATLEFTKDRVFKTYYYRFDKFDYMGRWFEVDGGYENHNLDKTHYLKELALAKYKSAEVFGLVIHYHNNNYILTSTPRYPNVLIDCYKNFKFEVLQSKLEDLVQTLVKHNLVHTDFAFRNICIDKENNFCLIDFEEMQTGDMTETYEKDKKDFFWLTYIESDFSQSRLPFEEWHFS